MLLEPTVGTKSDILNSYLEKGKVYPFSVGPFSFQILMPIKASAANLLHAAAMLVSPATIINPMAVFLIAAIACGMLPHLRCDDLH